MSDPVPPNVNEDQLRLLLDEQHESEILDYKSELDLLDKAKKARALAEIAKDVAALLSGRGGHLVVGADENGRPTGLLSVEQVAQLDEARLRNRLEKFIPDGLEIRVATHEIDGELVTLIHVAPHPDGLVIMKADGVYRDHGVEKVVFREGDIFIRRGTESRRLGQAELRRHIAELRRGVESEARADALRSIAPLVEQTQQVEALSSGAADRLSWDLDRETLVSAITEQLRRGDQVPLRLLLDSAPAQAAHILRVHSEAETDDLEAMAAEARAQLGGLLDRISAIAVRGLVIQDRPLIELSIGALDAIYNGAFDERGYQRRDLSIEPARIWLAVIERVYALGALAVRKRDWKALVELTLRRPQEARGSYYRAWLRHGHIMAARAGLLADPESQRIGTSVLKLALDLIAAIPELRPDYGIDDERLLSSLAQFDILSNLAVIAREGQVDGALIYPHFRRFYGHRSDPAVIALLEDKGARDVIFPSDDQSLAEALRDLGEIGSGEFFFVSGWDGYEDERIRVFLAEHPNPGLEGR